jgi:hypothetical protein
MDAEFRNNVLLYKKKKKHKFSFFFLHRTEHKNQYKPLYTPLSSKLPLFSNARKSFTLKNV